MSQRNSSKIGMLTLAIYAFSQGFAFGYTPESEVVQVMVGKGRAYLEANFGKDSHDASLGGVCICALACYSHTGNAQHALVQKAVAQIRAEGQKGFARDAHANYSLGIALIFLGTVDPDLYRQEVQTLLSAIYERQESNGAWTYPNDPLGDTSQTQYACLGMWMADRQGISIDQRVLERCCNWLLRTQAPDGAFGYKPNDPGTFDKRLAQTRTTPSMGTAGVGSLYVCGELLGFIDDPAIAKRRLTLPPAIRPVVAKTEIAEAVDHGRWDNAIRDGNGWIGRNAGVENSGGQQQYYYMYAVERYWAFRELSIATPQAEPPWYNAGVEYCRTKQATDGTWTSENGKSVDTAFAMLFLLRSSKKVVTQIQMEQGRLRGGKGLSADMSTAQLDAKGQVVTSDGTKAVADILAMLDDPKAPQAEFVSDVPEKLVLSSDSKERALQLSRLRRMIINGAFQARLTAAKTLGTIRDLDSAPALIFALSDPDWRIAKAARDSLRFMSRKPEGFGFVIEGGTRPEQPAWKEAQKNWTNWLLSVRPDAELIE
ncbi:MAG: hypothetical protein O3C40_21435 [Planctomycetota bacterium]|nr:hypothetical protein [Planctomycetota bacterium]